MQQRYKSNSYALILFLVLHVHSYLTAISIGNYYIVIRSAKGSNYQSFVYSYILLP